MFKPYSFEPNPTDKPKPKINKAAVDAYMAAYGSAGNTTAFALAGQKPDSHVNLDIKVSDDRKIELKHSFKGPSLNVNVDNGPN